MDPTTTTALAVIAATPAGQETIKKLLGPTADYIGVGVKDLIEKGKKNVSRILQAAVKKLGPKIDEPGQIPPRVIQGLLTDGPFCDDELRAEYLGGVLACARSGVSRDDRAASIQQLVGSLSAYQLRTHYIIYACVRKFFVGSKINLGIERYRADIYIPDDVYEDAMAFVEGEDSNQIIAHSLAGLYRAGLIEDHQFGPVDHIQKTLKDATRSGLIARPSVPGVELFLWAHGFRDCTTVNFLTQAVTFKFELAIKPGARAVISSGERYLTGSLMDEEK